MNSSKPLLQKIEYKYLFCFQLFSEHFKKYTSIIGGKCCVTLQDFQRFLLEEQQETKAENSKWVSEVMRDFLRDSQREVKEPYLTTVEVNHKKKNFKKKLHC